MNKILIIVALLISTVFAQNASVQSNKGDFKRFCIVLISGEKPKDTDLYYFGYLAGAINMAKMVHLTNGKKITERQTMFLADNVCEEALIDKEAIKKVGFINTLHSKAYDITLKQ